ncbi:hypothetical protein F4680DRAFT_120239 [Xylaria scruposa]|nr:hypothetical protein F4680DRAFT_120239 [Xylaria scruposa]
MTSREIADKYLPRKGPGRAMWAYTSYVGCFEWPSDMRERIPNTNIPGPGYQNTVVWIVEAPLNSVEVLEALLKPTRPLQIFTARHIPRGCVDPSRCRWPTAVIRTQKAYREFTKFQGRLTEDREISFVCVPEEAVDLIRTRLLGRFCPVMLCYISIPFSIGGEPILRHPWALVLHHEPLPGGLYTYENRLNALLDDLSLTGCGFERSLLKPGTTPLPECLWDWYVGVPGHSAALPYYAVDTGALTDKEVESSHVSDTENKEVVEKAKVTVETLISERSAVWRNYYHGSGGVVIKRQFRSRVPGS